MPRWRNSCQPSRPVPQQPQELDGVQKWSSPLTAAVNEREDGEKEGGRVRKTDMGQQS